MSNPIPELVIYSLLGKPNINTDFMANLMRPALLGQALRGEARFFIQFGGQGNSFLRELRALYRNYPELGPYFQTVFLAIDDFMQRPDIRQEKELYYPYGFDLEQWLQSDEAPPAEYLHSCQISLTGNQVTQLANYYLAMLSGYDSDELLAHTIAATGHSQGLQAAATIALGKNRHDFLPVLYDFVFWFGVSGFLMQKAYGFPEIPEHILTHSLETDRQKPTPMAVVSNVNQAELEEYLQRYNVILPFETRLAVSLRNSDSVFVVTGHARDLAAFRQTYLARFRERKIGWSYLDVSAPFHRPDFIEHAIHTLVEDPISRNFRYSGHDLKIPVISFFDGVNLQASDNLSPVLAELMALRPLDWEKAISPLHCDPRITHVLDFGPGKISSLLTKSHLQEKPVQIVSAVGKSGMGRLLSPE